HFLATQFHPEFKSRPQRPAPVFKAFVEAAIRKREEQGIRSEEVSPRIQD
ncbi:MAG: hypothetical protein LN412_06725, partial [Candidatus Thermoplasmatota archaeon]|nr:hypothetical protein [Candidatus Thermoplasmatota archaeon]